MDEQDSSYSNQLIDFNFLGYNQEKEQSNQQDSIYKIKKINPKTLPQTLNQIWKRKNILDSQFLSKMITLQSKKITKSICAKIFNQGDTIVECFNCRMDSTCVICLDCFKNGNHEGHKYVIRAAGGGCCDCGDKQAWKVEGFCKKHNGKFNDFQIDQKSLSQAKQKISGLLYLYFYINIKKLPYRQRYNQALITYLQLINTNNPYYNKITSLIFTSPLPSNYELNQKLNKLTILQNILTFIISQNWIKKWLDVFICMFTYYPFKLQIIKCFIQNYGKLVDGSQQSFSAAGSISCQLLSSYQLIQKYSQLYKIGLGQKSPIPQFTKFQQLKIFRRYFIRLYYDLDYFNKLAGQASLKYWKMHINSQQSLSNIFKYYQIILKFYQSLTQINMAQKQITVNIIQLVSIQEQAICNFIKIMKSIKKQKQLLNKVIKFLWIKCVQYSKQDNNILYFFRPYQRCLSLALFTYFGNKFQNSKILIDNLLTLLKINKQQFSNVILTILQKILTTYMIYPQSISQPGFGQSIYVFLYFYKIKFSTLSTVDMLSIKLLTLLKKQLNNSENVNIFSIANLHTKIQQQQQGQQYKTQLKKKKIWFNSILNFIRYLYATSLPQINIAFEIDKSSNQYKQQNNQILQRLFYQNKGIVSVQKLNIINTKLFVKQNQYIKQWVKQNCTQNKQKKQFVYNKYKQQLFNKNGINFTDIWQNSLLQQNIRHSDPHKTKQVIKGNNLKVFQQIWNTFNIQKLSKIVKQLYSKYNEGIQIILQNILHIYLLKQNKMEGKMMKEQIINKYVSKMPMEIRKLFSQFNNQMVQQIQDKQAQKQRRKSKFEQLKMKKLQKFKQNQNKVLNTFTQVQQQQIPPNLWNRKSSKQIIKQQNQQQHAPVCCICRNSNEQKLVYLVSVQPRNNEKLLKLGLGVNCFAFYSCYHTFDYDCIKSKFNNIQITNNIKCPLCKTSANILLPLHPQAQAQKVNDTVLHKIFAILLLNLTNNQLQTQSIYEEIIKSIYHFAIVVLVQPKILFKNRTHIYQNLLQIVNRLIKAKQIQQIKIKFEKQFKQYQQVKQVAQKKKIGNQKKIQTLKHKKILKQSLPPLKSKLKKVQSSPQKIQKSKKEEQTKQHFPLYKVVIKNIIQMLQKYSNQILIMEEQKTKQLQYNQYNQFANIFSKVLFLQKISEEQKNYILNKKPLQCTNLLRKLPQKYASIGANSKCTECNQLGANMVKCLLCQWSGCQKCELGKSQKHTQLHHGGIGVFMLAQSSVAFYQSTLGISVIGPIYENPWGHVLTKTQKWQQFQINSNRIKNIENTLFYDRPLTYIQK